MVAEGRTIRDLVSSESSWVSVENFAEAGLNELLAAFMKLFPFRHASVIRRPGAEKWLEISRFHNLSDHEVLEALQANSKLQRGYRCEDETRVLIMRIPQNSPYRNQSSVNDIRQSLRQLELEPRHYQIDEDWFLYIYLKNGANAAELCSQLKYWCILQGLVVGKDTIEVLPGDEPLAFPLQGKFVWLNERCQFVIRRDELSVENALAFFLDDAAKVAVDATEIAQSLKKASAFLKAVLEPGELRSSKNVLPLPLEPVEGTEVSNVEVEFQQDSLLDFLPEQGAEELAASKEELDFVPDDDGSRLVIFHDSCQSEYLAQKPENSGAQLFLFPRVASESVPEEVQAEAVNSDKPAARKPRKERKRKE